VEKFLDLAYLRALLDGTIVWAQANVFVLSAATQAAIVLLAFCIAWFVAPKVRTFLATPWTHEWYLRFGKPVTTAMAPLALPVVWLALQWFTVGAAESAKWPHHLIKVVVSLLTAWVVIRMAATLVRNHTWSRTITIVAWTIAALNITGLLDPAMDGLDAMAVQAGNMRLSLLGLIKVVIALCVFLWAAGFASTLVEKRVSALPGVTPAAGVLLGKLFRIAAYAIAVIVGLETVGIDLTTFAVFSGAIGLGIGFGLQKVFSNLISGLILLMDRSVKPGDVIGIGDTFGWINSLGARYVSVITRDGTEHLIPNEELISQRVENWSHSNELVRLRLDIGVAYEADVRKAMDLAVEAAIGVERVLEDPAPVCRLMEFGGDSVNLQLRVWIKDPKRGVVNVTSDVLLGVWDLYKENDIDFPFAQRDLHIKSAVPLPVQIASSDSLAEPDAKG